jgi:2',3'-cyclic-nucleotide 2'-phosphodiesterase (5'-nucleotidase family)
MVIMQNYLKAENKFYKENVRMGVLRSMKKKVLCFIIATVMVLGVLPVVSVVLANELVTITIFHTNDIHGRFYQVDSNNAGMIGIDRIAAIKNNTPNAILVDAGDTIHGLPIVNINQGLNAIEMMVAAGYSVMSAGNHEFNYGRERLTELAGIAAAGGLDIISANVFAAGTNDLFLPATSIVETGGVKVGFFGLSPRTTPIQSSPLNVAGLEFRDYVASARTAASALKADGADVIVALAHVSREGVLAIANELGGYIDVIIEGHDHRRGYETVNGVLVAGAGDYMTGLGVVSVTVNAAGVIINKTASLIPRADTLDIEGDPAVRAIAERMKAELLEEFGVVVAHSSVFIDSARGDATTPGVRNSEQPLGNLVADAMRIIGGADVAIQNGGGLRADIQIGDLTKLDVNAILPFGNVLVIKEVTPRQLREVMEQGLRDGIAAVGWFPQVSGMTVVFDPDRVAGERVVSITVNEAALDLNDNATRLRLAVNNFMASGGDGYTILPTLPTVAELISLDDMLVQYIMENLGGTITAENARVEGRLGVNRQVVDRTMSLYANKGDTTPVAAIAPQVVIVIERDGSWVRIHTWIGPKWINIG